TTYYNSYLNDWAVNILPLIRNQDLRNPDLYHQKPSFRDHIFDASDQISEYFITPYTENFREEKFTKNLLRNRMFNELFHEA